MSTRVTVGALLVIGLTLGSLVWANFIPERHDSRWPRKQGWFEMASTDIDRLEAWFALGVILECAILWAGLRQPLTQTAFYTLLMNLVTHPVAWALVVIQQVNFWLVESCVVAVETVLILLMFKVVWRCALTWSLAANTVSAGAGLLFSRIA